MAGAAGKSSRSWQVHRSGGCEGAIIQKLLMRGAEVVRTSVKTSVKTEVALKGEETLPLDTFFTTVPAGDGQFELRMLIELQPQGITFEQIGRQYAARVDVIIRLSDEADRVITENSASLPMELTREQLDRSKAFPLRYIYETPVLAGRYKADVIAVDVVSGKGGRVERDETVDEREAGRRSTFPAPAAGHDAFWFEAAELSDAERHSILGQQYLDAGKLEQAANELDRALQDNPLDQDVLVKLGRTRLELGQNREALEAVDSVLWYDRWNLDALLVSSVAQLRLDRVDDCRGTIDLVLRQYPGSIVAINHCANAYLELGEKERAQELFCRSLEIEPDQPQVKSVMEGFRTR
ncbi:MAG: tetratricopeptide repeat protein [Acidobacteriota bacterium]